MRLSFIKCHGSGNDFAMVDARGMRLSDGDWAGAARALSDRAGPVGADGLILLTDAEVRDGGARLGYRMFNPDGSEAETCLNGLRCVARMGFETLGVDRADARLVGSTAAVERDAEIAPGVYTVREAATASLDAGAWLRTGRARVVDEAVPPLGTWLWTAVSIPNPHLVAFVELVDEAQLIATGEICEAAPDWLPGRANVSFVEVRGPDLFVRTFERGAGLTDSCGSAMAASTFAACLTGRIAWRRPTTVWNCGGLVRAEAQEDGTVSLSGNATYEWAGEVEVRDGRAEGLRVTRRYGDEVEAWAAARGG